MSDLEPVKEFVTIELWEFDSGRIGWKMNSNCNEELDKSRLEHMLFELAESFMGVGSEGSPAIATLFMAQNSRVVARSSPDVDFTLFKNWIWLKEKLWSSQWYFIRAVRKPSWRWYLWTLEFMWHKVTGHLKPSQTAATASPAPPSALQTDRATEASEKLTDTSQLAATGGVVVPLFRQSDDKSSL